MASSGFDDIVYIKRMWSSEMLIFYHITTLCHNLEQHGMTLHCHKILVSNQDKTESCAVTPMNIFLCKRMKDASQKQEILGRTNDT